MVTRELIRTTVVVMAAALAALTAGILRWRLWWLKTSLNHSLAAVAERQIQMLRDKELICNMLWIFLSKKRFWCGKNIQYNREETCHTCGGNGAKPGTQPETCHKCHGSGTINVERQTPLGRVMSRQTCDVCHGTGKKSKNLV